MTTRQVVLFSPGIYLLWVIATYLLEGRVQLLQRPDPLGRALYAIVANILVGTALAGWVLQTLAVQGLVTPGQAGFRSARRTVVAIVLAALLGFGLFLLQRPRTLEPLVLLNVFAQVLPTSIAELMVCWALVGVAVETLTQASGRAGSLIAASAVASALFGLYHFAHSAPFNQPPVVIFLTLIGLVTSLIYFGARDVYAAAIVHNYLGMTGIINSADLAIFRQPLYPLYGLAVLAIATLVGVHVVLGRVRRRPERAADLAG